MLNATSSSLADPQLIVGLAPMKQFLDDPISDILVEKGKDTSFGNETNINIFIGSPEYYDHFPHNYGSTVLVETLDDLRSWENRLLSSPILLDARCKLTSTKEKSGYEGYWAVVCNTRHPNIRWQMESGFEQAKCAIQEGKRYMLQFSFCEMITTWFKDRGLEEFKCEFATLQITNHTFFEDLKQTLCGYDKCKGVILSVLCWPCIMCGVCVNSVRLCHRLDTQIVMEGSPEELQMEMESEHDHQFRSNQNRGGNSGSLQTKDAYGCMSSDYGSLEETDITEKTKLLN